MVASPSVPPARVYVGLDTSPANLVSGTSSGDFDENECEHPGIFVPAGQKVFVEWTFVFGGTAMARIEYVEA